MHLQKIAQYCLPIIIILISSFFPRSYSQSPLYSSCSTPYNCGETIRGIGYPFLGQNRDPQCGFQGLELKCQENTTSTIEINSRTFRVLSIIPNAHFITIARNDLWESFCPHEFFNTTLNETLYYYDNDTDQFVDLYYTCSSSANISARNTFTCNRDGTDRIGFFVDDRSPSSISLPTCEATITVPVLRTAMDKFRNNESFPIMELINEGFRVQYRVNHSACTTCQNSGGLCWSGTNTSMPTCLCRDGIFPFVCGEGGSNGFSTAIIIGIVVGVAAMVCLAIGLIIYFNYSKFSFNEFSTIWKSKTQNDKQIEAFLTQYGFSAPRRYRYFELKKMTNSFKDELGQGGFGSVYKGILLDGSLVAVKVLKESNENGEDFINEVASIGKTSHINIVALLGFCYEGKKRALVYEFMPNGSLEKFIYRNTLTENSHPLGVEKLFEIAIGIARGLEYLHRGCSTRILHFDIKPHNILLDEDFCPKISDFGLAKLYSRKDSVISVEARGTIGYTAPEVFNRGFGGVSHKSDVYSYGMMVLEMVSGRKNLDYRANNSSEIYFPEWIYKKIEINEDMQLQHEKIPIVENQITKKMILVGLWCIQTNPSERPSMNKVIEMLEGTIDVLKIPPDPFFSSPPSSEVNSSSMLLDSISLE